MRQGITWERFATPDMFCVVPGLPMTRSGKIRRHIFHEMYQLGDTITLADPGIVDILIEKVVVVVLHGKTITTRSIPSTPRFRVTILSKRLVDGTSDRI